MLFNQRWRNKMMMSFAPLPLLFLSLSYSHLKLFLIFLKVGLVLFGSGYVLFAYLDGELIDGMGWLSHDDLVEAIAIGQMTPGPVLSTATFIGYKVGGFGGAILATLGIFVPSFFYVWALNRFIHKMQGNKDLSQFSFRCKCCSGGCYARSLSEDGAKYSSGLADCDNMHTKFCCLLWY